MVSPEEVAERIVSVMADFFGGRLDYPEVELKLAGEEAEMPPVPKLRRAIHHILKTIRDVLEEYGIEEGDEIPGFVKVDIFERIKPDLRLALAYAEDVSVYEVPREDVDKIYEGKNPLENEVW